MQLKKRRLPLFLIIKMKSIKATKRIKRTERTKRIKKLKTAASIILALTLLTISILSAPGSDVYAESMPGAAGAVQPIFAYSSMEVLAKNGEALDLRAAAGQNLYGYDTLQGACANGGCAYYTLFNRNKNKCRIVRLDLASLNVIQVSAPLKIYHANNLTFNTKRNLLVVTCCQVKGKRAVFIDPITLTVVLKKDIKLKASKSIPKSVVRKYSGFTAIAYNEKYDCYIGRLRGNNNVIIFDGELKPLSAPVPMSCEIEPIRAFQGFGRRIYRHSICFLLCYASRLLFPRRRLKIGHSLGDGFYFNYEGDKAIDDATYAKNDKWQRG